MGDVVGIVATAVFGAVAGIGIAGMADHFTFDRSLSPASICPHCGAPSSSRAYVPLIGPMLLRGACRRCEKRSSWPVAVIVQCVTALLFAQLFRQFGFGPRFAATVVETYVLVAVALIDAQHRLIPTLLVYPTIVFAVAVSPIWPDFGLLTSLAGGGMAFALFFALALLARLTFGEGALGGGDVTLAALIGAICGYPLLVLALALGALFGGLGAIAAIAVRRTALGTAIPYGPFLVAGVLYVMLNGYTVHPLITMP